MSGAPIPESVSLGPLERQLVRALQLEPRASYSRLADVLGTSEQTAARRYRALRQAGLVRVVGAVDPRALGQNDWLVRLRCRPNGAAAVADALARREDVSWLTINSGGSEMLFALRSRTAAERDDLLVARLPRSAPVLDTAAFMIMRRFVGSEPTDWRGLEGSLTPTQTARLTATPAVVTGEPVTLEPGDDALLDLLLVDGRASYAELARATGMTIGKVTRRVDALTASGVVYFDIDVAVAAIGPLVGAYLWLRAPLHRWDAVGRELGRHEEVQFAAAITGQDNLVAHASAPDLDQLYRYLTTRLAAVDGISQYAISPVVRRVKQAGTITKGDRLVEPEPIRRRRPTRRTADRQDNPADEPAAAPAGARRSG